MDVWDCESASKEETVKKFLLALAALIMVGFAFAPKPASASYSGIALGLARVAPSADIEKARIVCRRGYYRWRCFRTSRYYRHYRRCRVVGRFWRHGRRWIVRRCWR
jgi:hypothetical protein